MHKRRVWIEKKKSGKETNKIIIELEIKLFQNNKINILLIIGTTPVSCRTTKDEIYTLYYYSRRMPMETFT
jgi:hypothetical protein